MIFTRQWENTSQHLRGIRHASLHPNLTGCFFAFRDKYNTHGVIFVSRSERVLVRIKVESSLLSVWINQPSDTVCLSNACHLESATVRRKQRCIDCHVINLKHCRTRAKLFCNIPLHGVKGWQPITITLFKVRLSLICCLYLLVSV